LGANPERVRRAALGAPPGDARRAAALLDVLRRPGATGDPAAASADAGTQRRAASRRCGPAGTGELDGARAPLRRPRRPPPATDARSPHAHARILDIALDAARTAPGVAAVLTAGDLPGDLAPIPMRMFSQPGMERFLQSPLAADTVRYSGDPVAIVVADSRY